MSIIKEDPIHSHDFDPINDIYELSYNSSRTVVPSYNIYNNKNSEFLITGYINVKDQYDGRLIYENKKDQFGLGFDLSTVNPFAYDKISFNYFAITGDNGIHKDIIKLNSNKLGLNDHVPVVVDIVGSLESNNNVGLINSNNNNINLPNDYRQTHCNGLLGGLNQLKHKNHNLKLSFVIGGPDLSTPFQNLVKNLSSRIEFTQGVLDILMRFPMFNSIEIDWRCNSNNQVLSKEDCDGLTLLITELKKEFNENGLHDIQINIIIPGSINQLKVYNFKDLLNAGVNNFYVLTLNYFNNNNNSQSSNNKLKINHNSNLYSIAKLDKKNSSNIIKNKIKNHQLNNQESKQSFKDSIDKTVHYLIDIGKIPSRKIHIAYSTFGKSSCDTKIKQFDINKPLKGKFKNHDQIIGTFESGIITFNDIITHYLNQDQQQEYQLFYDRDSKSDFIYNLNNKVFITFDSPKSVREKAEYVRQNRLGGLFNTSIGYDASGLLVNAAKEGLGLQIENEIIDMSKFYQNGKDNINNKQTNKQINNK